MNTELIPVAKAIGPNLDAAYRYMGVSYDVGQFSNFGPLVKMLERRLAQRLGVTEGQVVVFSSATTAISAALASSGASYVRLPDLSFVATLSAVRQAGLAPVIEDVQEPNWILDSPPLLDEGFVNLPVLPFGAVDNRLVETSRPYPQVIDAAASLGGDWNLSRMADNISITFSFHATKPLGAGEGGVAVFGSEIWAAKARRWSNFGLDDNRRVHLLGINAKMSEFQAAFCLSALDTWEQEKAEWIRANNFALGISSKFNVETLLATQKGNISSYWIVKVSDGKVNHQNLTSFFLERGVRTRFWWNNSLATIERLPEREVSSKFRNSYVGLPMFRNISQKQLLTIGEVLGEWLYHQNAM